MMVMDDVGGMSGFIRLLNTLYSPDYNESEVLCETESRDYVLQWAHGMGWSERKISNKRLL